MKPLKVLMAVAVLLFAALLLASCERKVTNETTIIVSEGAAKYVGSEQCEPCHGEIHADFVNSGHPYKLNNATDAQQPGYYPFGDLEGPPPNYSWSDVSHVIGGFRWKARFIDQQGYIITGADANATTQWNLPTNDDPEPEWVGYHAGEQNKEYDCGPCHMTAYNSAGHQLDLPGMIGTWAFDGVQCEECHGPGEFHVGQPQDFGMKIDRSNEQCGKCHIRGEVSSIPASGGFIRHHEQWNEMFASKHASIQCVTCHDPHKGLHELNPDRAAAIQGNCEACHFTETAAYEESGLPHHDLNVDCIDCHMPKAAKSARAVADYVGDVRSHLFGINTDPDAPMFSEDGGTALGYLTLEYTCLQCHSSKDKAWAAGKTALVHPDTPSGEVATCFGCHSDQNFELVAARQQWENSKHGSGDNINRNRAESAYYQSCERCHTNEGFIARITGEPADGEHFTKIYCFTCHEPHATGSLALRTEAPVTLADGKIFDYGPANLCVNCHQSRRNVNTYVVDDVELSEHFGPHHSNQGDVIAGTGGYEYDGYSYTSSAHTATATDGCINCHMTGSQANVVGGHSFNMRSEEFDFELLAGCNLPQCHGNTGALTTLNRTAAADFDGDGTTEGVQDEIAGLVQELEDILFAAGLIEEGDEGFHPTEDLVVPDADSSGAVYNWEFVKEERSGGVHNTKYAVGLLQSSINYMTAGDPNGVAPRRGGISLSAAH